MIKKVGKWVALGALVPVVALAGIDAHQAGAVSGARTGLTIIAPASAGGGWDTVARELQAAMRENGVVSNPQVVNMPGAAGTIGLNQLLQMHGREDVVLVTGTTMVGGIEVNGLGQDLTQTVPLRRLADDYMVLAVPASSPYRTLEEFVAAWQKDPGALSIGGGSLGGTEHVLSGLMGQAAGLDPEDINYISYSGGGEILTSMLSNSIDAGISSYVEFGSQIESGDMRALAISAPEPVDGIEVPTFHEAGLEVDLINWRGVVAAPGVAGEDLEELNAIIDETVATGEWQNALERNRWDSEENTAEQFSAFIAEETDRIRSVIEEAGL
ncbi:tricarboxylic transporter [Kocuria sp. WN036]|uniref:Bug family tripartite tricarboxylate transporter substrate binding protein n=2 Tax=unclassified Kocuria TaxID=2649579 RepID=UPI000BAB9122|nr:tripartite tricarboxylate transporter substrate-binding protein [Kocuria sp. WN036]PAU86427.1 tricarboxylic transporter [Kocuria sp. WN036]